MSKRVGCPRMLFIEAEASHYVGHNALTRGVLLRNRHCLRIRRTRVRGTSRFAVCWVYSLTLGVVRISLVTPLRIISDLLIKFIF